ncbi:hypothetical protein [Paenibacillus sp. GYB003]|uniref:hypothetical protein n=1 Tax=Paenibacillus sp. GYB003 TaxID=2994392 RepID=UPI002F963361
MNNKNIFFEEDFKLYYGPKKGNVCEIDLINHEEVRLDNFQILQGVSYLLMDRRIDDATKFFSVQTGCTLDEAIEFIQSTNNDNDEISPITEAMYLAELKETADALHAKAAQRRTGIIAYFAGAAIMLVVLLVLLFIK